MNSLRHSIAACVLLSFAIATSPAATDPLLLPALRVPLVPRVDADAWQRAARVETFYEHGSLTPAAEPTRMLLLAGPEGLHVRFLCRQQTLPGYGPSPRDSEGVWSRDAIEFHIVSDPLDPNAPRGQYSVNPSNSIYDARNANPRFNGVWESSARRIEGGWRARLLLPWALLGRDGPPSEGEPVLMSILASRRNSSGAGGLSCIVPLAESFHHASGYWPLLIGSAGSEDAARIEAVQAGQDVETGRAFADVFVHGGATEDLSGRLALYGAEESTPVASLASGEVKLAGGQTASLRLAASAEQLQKQHTLLVLRAGSGQVLDAARRLKRSRPLGLSAIRKLRLIEQKPGQLLLAGRDEQGREVRLRVAAVAGGGLRVQAQTGERLEEHRTLMLSDEAPRAGRFVSVETLEGKGGGWRARTDRLGLRIRAAPLGLELLDAAGRPLSSGRGEVLSLGRGGEIRMSLRQGERIYGLGQPAEPSLDQRGQIRDIWVRHQGPGDFFMPFFLSTAGYGVFVNTSYRSFFDMGALDEQTWSCQFTGGPLDCFFLPAANMAEGVERYTALTGRSPLPPLWAFGFWQSTVRFDGQTEFTRTYRTMREKALPCDVLALDPSWQACWNDFRWHARFPEPEAMMEELEALHYKLCLWTSPFVNPNCSTFEEGREKGCFARTQEGEVYRVSWWLNRGKDGAGLVDFTDPQAARWWGELHEPLIRQGVDVFKTDGGDGAQVPSDAVFAAGTGERIHNLYPLYFARTISDVQLAVEPDRRSCVWIRTGTSGIQRWPCAWGGDQIADFSGGRKLIKGGQSVGLSGVSFWSHDLGGFSYNRTAEYVVRSYQWGLLSPLSRAHGGLNEPWAWGERAERIIARFLDLRYRLMPYIYSLAWQSHRTGLPMMRAMVLAFPEDPRARGRDYQYAFGPSLLVAPIYEASTREDLSSSRSVYLPEGLWYALADDTPHAGGRERVVDVPLEELPVFVRAGALIPQLPSAPQHLDGATFGRELELHAWAGGRGRFTLTEDDGQSLGYTRGEYATTELACEQAGEVFTVTIGERSGSFEGIEATRPRSWRVVVHGLEGPPATVLRNGEDAEPRDWSWDADARLLSVEAGGAGRLTIRRPETD